MVGRCPHASPGVGGTCSAVLELNWAGLAVSGSLAHGTGCSGTRSGAVLQWEWRHWCCVICAISWPHTSARVTGLQPFTLVSAHSRHARHWSHHGTCGVDCTVPRGPTNRQYSPVRLRPAVSVRFLRISPTRPAPSCLSARACFPRLCDPTSLLICPLASHPATSQIFPVLHSYPTLVSINPSVDLRVHCVVHLAQDCFLHRSSGRLRSREGCQGCGASPFTPKPNVTPPPSGVASPSTLGRERREQTIPQIKDYIINKQNRLNAPGYIARAWAHYNTFRGAPFP